MKRQREPLGKLCKLVKGISPISKTPPGPYSLVTTSEEHKTADTFQFDGEAVCIPTVSSTGHGHASLKRVHYQAGKFALSNILVAAQVKDVSVMSTRYLAWYLTYTKDRLIVPLMTGAANMSLSVDRLATVPVEFPSLSDQERIVNLLDEAVELRKLRSQADLLTTALIPALFYEMFVCRESKDWQKVRLGEVAEVKSGAGFPMDRQGLLDQSIPFFKVGDMNARGNEWGMHIFRHSISEGTRKELGAILLPAGSVIFPKVGGAIGTNKKRVLVRASCVDNNVMAILPGRKVMSNFLLALLAAKNIADFASNANPPSIRKTTVENWRITLPPLSLQGEFSNTAAEIRGLEAEQATSRSNLDALFQSLLHHAFQRDL